MLNERGWLHPQLPRPPCHSGVTVVGELAERVEDGELGVGGGEQGQGKGHRTTDHWVTIAELEGAGSRDTKGMGNASRFSNL